MPSSKINPPQSQLNRSVKKYIDTISAYLSHQSTGYILFLGFVFLLIIGSVNVMGHEKLSFSIFYLIPVCMVTWYTTRNMGLLFSLLGGVALTISHHEQIANYRQWIAQIWNSLGSVCFYGLTVLLLRTIKTKLEREKNLAQLDPLTGIANRRSFYLTLENEIHRAKRYNHTLTVVFIDLDNFKEVNDKRGHQSGDDLLKVISEKLSLNIRGTDFMARFGGDEFSILFPETDKERVSVMISRIRFAILDAMNENGWPVTLSIGVATFQNPPDNVDEAIGHVDKLMYSAKRKGKDRIEYALY